MAGDTGATTFVNRNRRIQRHRAGQGPRGIERLKQFGILENCTLAPIRVKKMRAAIARSLCMSPKIMLFDEPTSALEPEVVTEVLDTMVSLAEEGMATVCVTHEMGFARQVANRVIFMDAGQIVEVNEPCAFFNNPHHERTRLFPGRILD